MFVPSEGHLATYKDDVFHFFGLMTATDRPLILVSIETDTTNFLSFEL
jgi:hypothetical protein